jgi:uncharacterized membrane protein YqjE
MASSAPQAGAQDAAPAPDAAEPRRGGLLQSLRTLLATLLATLRTRGELLQVELEEERLRVAGIALFAVAAAVFLFLGVLLLSFFLVLLFWDSNRVLIAGLLALAYLLIGVVCALMARQRSRVKSKLFAASLAALDEDGVRLGD